MDHIHQPRIERALTLFRSTGLPADRVASAVGAGDVCYFHRIFKRRVGLTSGQFRLLRPSAGDGTADATRGSSLGALDSPGGRVPSLR